ncbi:hypothetical protein ACFWNR_07675 [Streptomyces virginiae]
MTLWSKVYHQAHRIAADGGKPEDLAAWSDEEGLDLHHAVTR